MQTSIEITLGICTKSPDATTIQGAIDSIIQQEFPHSLLEVVTVIDGQDANRTKELIEEAFAKSDISLRIFSDTEIGLGTKRQMIVDNAIGKLIIWVDDDIFLPKKYLGNFVRFMNQHPRVGFAQGLLRYEEKSLADSLENLAAMVDDRKLNNFNRLGTGGAACRVVALKQVGGFDQSIKGAGEDADVTTRIKRAGWALARFDLEFYHRSRGWRGFWNMSFWYGRSMFVVNQKHRNLSAPWKNLLPIAAIIGILLSMEAFSLTRRKIAFLLPFERVFKSTAWLIGYLSARANKHFLGRNN